MKPLIKIGPYTIEGFKIPIERRGLYKLLKNGIKIEESYSQLSLECTLCEDLLEIKGYKYDKQWKGYQITKVNIIYGHEAWALFKEELAELDYISIDYPDVVEYTINLLNEL